MKKIFFIIIVLLCIAFGYMRFYDLSNFTDSNGFVTVSTASMRYLLILIPIICIVAYAIVYERDEAKTFSITPFSIAMFILGIIHLICGMLSVVTYLYNPVSTVDLVLIVSMFFTGMWFSICAILSYSRYEPSGGFVVLAVFANILYYILMLHRYLLLVSSNHRISLIVAILAPMSVVLFFSYFVKHLFSISRTNIMLIFSGFTVFLVAGCIGFSEIYFALINGIAFTIPLLQSICMFSMGVFGLVCSAILKKKHRVIY